MRQDHQVCFVEHHPDVFATHQLPGAPAETVVARHNLLTKLAGQAVCAKQLVERLSDPVLLLRVDQFQQLEVTSTYTMDKSFTTANSASYRA
jgi:hypothetical protein